MSARLRNPFVGARRARPTKAHRPAVWESMLGTVSAMDATGAVRYFDYDYAAARAFAGIVDEAGTGLDLRLARFTQEQARVRWHNGSRDGSQPRAGQLVLWVAR